MKKVFLIILVITLSFCSKKNGKVPDGLYSKEEFANILKEVYILESKVKELKVGLDSAKKIYASYEKELFDKLQVDDSIYKESYKFYLNDLDELDDIYAIMVDSLSLEERLFQGKEEENEEDSLSNSSDSKDSVAIEK